MYNVNRFRQEKLIVQFDDYEDLHEFLCELQENGGLGTTISRERFEGGFKSQGYRHYYWSKEEDRLYCTSRAQDKPDYSVVMIEMLDQAPMAPSKTDVMSFLIGGEK